MEALERSQIILDSVLKYWVLIAFFVGWIVARFRAFVKRRKEKAALVAKELKEKEAREAQFDQMLRAINGVGDKVKALNKVVEDNAKASEARHSEAKSDTAYLKGKVDAMAMFYSQPSRSV